MGYLIIEKIGVNIPIYHGSDKNVLQRGIGHYEGSSLPIDGESVHAVLMGHTGLPSAKIISDLDKLEIGDWFEIVILNKVYRYEVDQIKIVRPDEFKDLEIVPNKQYVTLITCTPYGVNTHRLLVRGVLKNDEDTEIREEEREQANEWPIFVCFIIGFLIMIIGTGNV